LIALKVACFLWAGASGPTPRTPSKETTNWTTKVVVPKDVTGLYILVSVESKQADYFISHVIDITDK
jgi:hypothetical protein